MKRKIALTALAMTLVSASVTGASDAVETTMFPATFLFDGQVKTPDSEYAVLNYNGHAYTPVRFVAENLGALVEYDEASHTIAISRPPDVASGPKVTSDQAKLVAYETHRVQSVDRPELRTLTDDERQYVPSTAGAEGQTSAYYVMRGRSKSDTNVVVYVAAYDRSVTFMLP